MDFVNVEWVSVNDELPKDDEEVMVCGCNNYGKRGIGFTKFNRGRGWELHRCDFIEVFYWVYYSAQLPEFECESYCCEPLNKIMPEEDQPKSWWKKLFA